MATPQEVTIGLEENEFDLAYTINDALEDMGTHGVFRSVAAGLRLRAIEADKFDAGGDATDLRRIADHVDTLNELIGEDS